MYRLYIFLLFLFSFNLAFSQNNNVIEIKSKKQIVSDVNENKKNNNLKRIVPVSIIVNQNDEDLTDIPKKKKKINKERSKYAIKKKDEE